VVQPVTTRAVAGEIENQVENIEHPIWVRGRFREHCVDEVVGCSRETQPNGDLLGKLVVELFLVAPAQP